MQILMEENCTPVLEDSDSETLSERLSVNIKVDLYDHFFPLMLFVEKWKLQLFKEWHKGKEESSNSENWVFITCIGLQLVATAKDIYGFQGVCMLCYCLRKEATFQTAALKSLLQLWVFMGW